MERPYCPTSEQLGSDLDRLSLAHRRSISAWNLSRGIKDDTHWLGEILAVIHGDGGHYQEQHGTEKATKDAIEKINALRAQIS